MNLFRNRGCVTAAFVLTLARSGWSESVSEHRLYDHPQLDATTLALIYDKMSDITPDFRPYVQRSSAYTGASIFGRDKVFSGEMASLEARYATLDVHGVYVVKLSVPLQQYDSTAQAYGIGFDESSYIPFYDQAANQQYGVQFTNRSVIEKMPMTPEAAEAFARRFDLPITGTFAGNVILEMAFRIDTVPPPIGSGEKMLNAAIVAARVYAPDGRLMHDFAVTVSSPPSSTSSDGILKNADIGGLRLSMPVDAAIAVGKAGWTKQLGAPDEGVVLFFNGLEQTAPKHVEMMFGRPAIPAPGWAVCAGEQSGRQDSDDRIEGKGPPSFADCVAVVTAGGAINQISSEHHLTAIDPTALKSQLDAKYGTPVETANEGNTRIWVGHDPADPKGREVRIQAVINTLARPGMLAVAASYYGPPAVKAAQPNTETVPKL